MEDDSSNDVIAMESEDDRNSSSSHTPEVTLANREKSNLADKPLMQFFRRLLLNNVTQNTILTNAQIENILKCEFDLNLSSMHALEVEIYLSVVKTYLKEWPMWDEVEATTKELKESGESDHNFVNIMEKRYWHLKNFLKEKIELSRVMSADLLNKEKSAADNGAQAGASSAKDSKNTQAKHAVLEIKATRDQLNKLIYRQPHPGHSNTIFNVNDKPQPSHIRMNTLSLAAILNWWSIKITISLKANSTFISRETTHKLNHLLVNRQVEKRNSSTKVMPLNVNLQIKEPKKFKQVPKKQYLSCLDILNSEHNMPMEGMHAIIQSIKSDIERFEKSVAAPAMYRRYLSKYPYVRYLYSEVDCDKATETDKAKYDIQLQETISPMHQFYVGLTLDRSLPSKWLRVECVSCKVMFTGEKLETELKQHFDDNHMDEPDWQCTNCDKSFPMAYLAENFWDHTCELA